RSPHRHHRGAPCRFCHERRRRLQERRAQCDSDGCGRPALSIDRKDQRSILQLFPRRFHELDRRAVGIANVNNAFSGVRSRFENLRFARGFPTGRCNSVKYGIEIIDNERDMNMANVARSKTDMFFPILRREILEQLDLVATGCFYDSEFKFSAFDSYDFRGHFASLMRGMRKLEPEHIAPERERSFKTRDCDASVIDSSDTKSHGAENVQRSTPNVQCRNRKEICENLRICG